MRIDKLQNYKENYHKELIMNKSIFDYSISISTDLTLISLMSGTCFDCSWVLIATNFDRIKFWLQFKETVQENERGYKLKPRHVRSWSRPIRRVLLKFLSREIDLKMRQIYTKISMYKILYKNRRFKLIIFSKYATNLKTTISQKSLVNLGLLLLLYKL